MADIQAPDLETRIAILKKKAQQENIVLPEEIYIIIAEKITANIRKLEGALNRVVAYSTLTGSSITIENTEEILKDIFASGSDRQITGQLIIDSVARHFDIRNDDFKTIKRNREIAYPRQIAMFLCRMIADMSFPQIGDLMGGRDHTTVMHACRKIEDDIKKDMNLRRNIDELKRNITGK
jgi:chromosomal replication initiator protein